MSGVTCKDAKLNFLPLPLLLYFLLFFLHPFPSSSSSSLFIVTGSHYAAQVAPKLTIFRPQYLECWSYRYTSLGLALRLCSLLWNPVIVLDSQLASCMRQWKMFLQLDSCHFSSSCFFPWGHPSLLIHFNLYHLLFSLEKMWRLLTWLSIFNSGGWVSL